MNYQAIINKYYPAENELKRILMIHSRSVADKALNIIRKHPEYNANAEFIEEAAMLHDIGIFKCDAHSIECHGIEPYICHGRIGAQLLNEEGFPKHARVCERHTGAGITSKQIFERKLPIPIMDYVPETIEEQILCYADKFYSKTHLNSEKTIEQAINSLSKFGEDGINRFKKWVAMFE